jgi:hypothetical protein
MTAYDYRVKCVRCGTLFAFTWDEEKDVKARRENLPREAQLTLNWPKLHSELSRHQRPFRLHWLRFTKKRIG